MSRGVRDLRDLICISRSSYQEDETCSEDDEKVLPEFSRLSFCTEHASSESECSQCFARDARVVSPDSGCIINESSGICCSNTLNLSGEILTDRDMLHHTNPSENMLHHTSPSENMLHHTSPSENMLHHTNSSENMLHHTNSSENMLHHTNPSENMLHHTNPSEKLLSESSAREESLSKASSAGKSKITKSAKKRRKKKGNNSSLISSRHELPQSPILLPVQGLHNSLIEVNQNRTTNLNKPIQENGLNESEKKINFDDILPYMDATLVSNWLTRSNASIQELSKFFSKGDNFVQFAHFWLSEFQDIQRREIFSMEYEILLEEISLAFAVGKESRKVVRKDISELCEAVFKEFPVKLLAQNGSCVFLDYLDIMSSEKQDRYKKLLSDAHCSTSNRQYAQWLLATRCFALVSVWSAVVNFYRNLVGTTQGMPILDLCSTKEVVPHKRMLQAIRLGYTDVINYLITSGHVSPLYCDSHRRSLLFIAVMHNQTEAVRYLLTLDPIVVGINKPSDTGNTALHAASNSGTLAIVDLLCHCESIDLNCKNPHCENATPLHLAVMHGHTKVVECLLRHGADPHLNMGSTTVRDLARDFDHSAILELLDN